MQSRSIKGARRYDIQYLTDVGLDLVGTYFKERYSSDARYSPVRGLCADKGFVVIRETAVLWDHRNAGIALHVDVCESDLHLEAEPGVTNEAISRRIIESFRRKN